MINDVLFMPSMMCVNPAFLCPVIDEFEEHKSIGALHIDVMDGHFVPNIQLGTDYCRYIRSLTSKPLDFHMMVEQPENVIKWFDIVPGDIVSLHVESTNHLQRAADYLISRGAQVYAALNPATPLCMTEEILLYLSGILIMTVSPGYAGQKLVESTVDKISRCRNFLDDRGYQFLRIEVDGNVSFENYVRMKKAGADTFVIGSSGFLKTMDITEISNEIARFEEGE